MGAPGSKQAKETDKTIIKLEEELKNEQEPEIVEQIEKTIKRISEIKYKFEKEKEVENEILQEREKLEKFKRTYENKRILEKIDEEIKIWESIKSCNYSDKSVIFNKNINVDEILKQLNKAKQEKKFQFLEIWPLSVVESSKF
jgi:hypothetical protein